jgi:hypothetical protein
MDLKKLAETLHPLERSVLPLLKENKSLKEIKNNSELEEIQIMRALQWLENKKVLKIKTFEQEIISLDKNGKNYFRKGLPERQILSLLEKPIKLDELKKESGLSNEEFNIGLGVLKKKAAINIEKLKVSLTSQGEKLLDKKFLEEEFLETYF